MIELTVTELAGNVTVCDPVMTVVLPGEGKPPEPTFGDIPRHEHWVWICNGDPGIQHLEIAVNRKKLKEINLEAARRASSTSRPRCATATTPSR